MASVTDKRTFGKFQKSLGSLCNDKLTFEAEQEVTFEIMVEVTFGGRLGTGGNTINRPPVLHPHPSNNKEFS